MKSIEVPVKMIEESLHLVSEHAGFSTTEYPVIFSSVVFYRLWREMEKLQQIFDIAGG